MLEILLKKQDWSRARETAKKIVKLDPFCSSVRFRMSATYTCERDHIPPSIAYEPGSDLFQPFEKVAHVGTLERLKQLSEET
jgi:hypothetical protein